MENSVHHPMMFPRETSPTRSPIDQQLLVHFLAAAPSGSNQLFDLAHRLVEVGFAALVRARRADGFSNS
jgi:hypothetical protein